MKPTILVPFDFSTSAFEALKWAADLQSTTRSERPIHLIHVISSLPFGDPMSVVDRLSPSSDEIADLIRSLTEAASKAGARVETDVVIRPLIIGEAILAVAQEIHADLVVMGTHGRTGVKRLVLGSVAEHVTRHAPCPVVTVRETHEAAPR